MLHQGPFRVAVNLGTHNATIELDDTIEDILLTSSEPNHTANAVVLAPNTFAIIRLA